MNNPMLRILLAVTALAIWLGGASAAEDMPGVAADLPDYVDEAASAGIDHTYAGAWEFFVGGGVAVFDCDGDRRPDMFLAGGSGPAVLYRNRSRTGGAFEFEKLTLDIGQSDLTNVLGAYPLDIDNDGHTDLAVLRLGGNLLLRGDGDCRMTKANDAWAFDGGKDWTTAFSATFERDRTFPTLAFGSYVDRLAPGAPFGTCADNWLMRPAAGAVPAYDAAIPLTPGFCTLSMLFTDWNQSGTPALRVTNDRQYYRGGEEQMWHLEPGRAPRLYSAGDGWRHLSIWGMGIAEADLNADGYPEYALTSMGDTKLQQLDDEAGPDKPVYKDIAFERGATAQRPYQGTDYRPSTGWHSEFADLNNDGLLDLFIAKGNVEAMPEFAAYDPDNLLLGTWDGGFVEVGGDAGIALDRRGRGAALADLNLDGMLDIVVVNRDVPIGLFRNLGARTDWGHRPLGNWIAVELSQPGGNRYAVGARLSVKTGTRTVTRTIAVGGGHASGQQGFIHVGLGTAERAEIRVKWPDGEWSHAYRAFANNFIRIERGEAAAGYWLPPPPDE